MFRLLLFLSGLVALIASGCAGIDTTAAKTPEDSFRVAEEAMRRGHYEEATAELKKIRDGQHTAAVTAQAELRLADTNFAAENYIEAAAGYEDFRKYHPTHEQVPYALYRQALCQFKQINGFDTDQTPTKNAQTLFELMLRQYPQSEYATDARIKSEETRNILYRHEIYVGSFYLRTGKVQSAIKRLDEALQNFPPLKGTDELLFNLGKAYLASGERQKGRDILQRLASEYSGSKFALEAQSLAGKN
jgi:outer membrane protein assembly factor BamD